MRAALVEEAAVAEIEMLALVEQIIGGRAIFPVGEGGVARVLRILAQGPERGRRHEQGIAPAPAGGAARVALAGLGCDEQQVVGLGRGEDPVEIRAHRGERRRAGALACRPDPGRADDVVVGVIEPIAKLPAFLAPLREDRVLVAHALRAIGEVRERHPEGRLLPVARALGARAGGGHIAEIVHMGQLPVGDTLHRRHHLRAARQRDCSRGGRRRCLGHAAHAGGERRSGQGGGERQFHRISFATAVTAIWPDDVCLSCPSQVVRPIWWRSHAGG